MIMLTYGRELLSAILYRTNLITVKHLLESCIMQFIELIT